MFHHFQLLLKTCRLLLAYGLVTSPAHALNFVWSGDVDNKWHTINNWVPNEFGPPGTLDTATISNGKTVLIDSNFVAADFIDGLTISAGELRTNGFEAIVDNGDIGSTALTQVSGSNARLRVDLNSSGAGTDSFDTDRLSVANGGHVNLYGGRLEVDSGLLNVGSTGRLQGYGNIDLEYVVSTETVVLRNDGVLRVGVVDFGALMTRTLAINVIDADGRIDLDGLVDNGQVTIGLQATLDINGRLWDAFSSEMTFAPDSRQEMSNAWTADDFSTINVDAQSSLLGVPSRATIAGATMTHGGLLNVNSGTLFVDSDFEGYLGTIEVGGQGKAATICFRGQAVVGAVHLKGTQSAPAKICGDNIEFRPDSFTLVSGYAIGEGDFLPWQNNFGAGSKIQIDGSSSPSKFEIDGIVTIAGDLQFDGAATLAADQIDISGSITVKGGESFLSATGTNPVILSGDLNLVGLIAPMFHPQSAGTLDAAITGTVHASAPTATITGNVLFEGAQLIVDVGSTFIHKNGAVEFRNEIVNVAGDIQLNGPASFTGATSLNVESLTIDDYLTISGDTTVTAENVIFIDPFPLTVDPNQTLRIDSDAIASRNHWYIGDGARAEINTPSPWTAEGNIALGGGATFGGQSFTSQGLVSGNGKVFIELLMPARRWINDGAVAIGASPWLIEVNGDYEQTAAGELQIELAGLTPVSQFDQLQVAGAASLGGTLDVSLLNSFSPQLGDSFQILTALGGVFGDFASVQFPAIAPTLAWELNLNPQDVTLLIVPALPGDFDVDGDRDGRDFLIWQRGGSPNPLSSSDLADWEANFGGVSSSSASSTAVPEPTVLSLLAISSMALVLRRTA